MSKLFYLPLIAGTALSIVISANAVAGQRQAHSELLENCSNEILEKHPEAEMSLLKKTQVGVSKYKLWIEINSASQDDDFKAYCEGKARGGKIDKLAIGEGKWRSDRLVSETTALLDDNS